jgi:hypothetical protein
MALQLICNLYNGWPRVARVVRSGARRHACTLSRPGLLMPCLTQDLPLVLPLRSSTQGELFINPF